MTHPEIDLPTVNEWQEIADLVMEQTGAACVLVMKKHSDSMEVFTGSSNEDSPCKAGIKVPLDTGLYSEVVINEQTPLHVSNGKADPRWNDSLDLDLGLVFFYGVPLNWPDGEAFGAFCIMDRKERQATALERQLVYRFSKSMETALALLDMRAVMAASEVNDYLTKVPNRHNFISHLQKELNRAKRYGQPLCLTILDIDHLTEINEQQGIDVGDEILVYFAHMLEQMVRESDMVARISGSTFALMTPGTKRDQAIQLIERFRQIIENSKEASPFPELQFSAGIAEFSNNDANYDGLLKRTENVLRMAKAKGLGQTYY